MAAIFLMIHFGFLDKKNIHIFYKDLFKKERNDLIYFNDEINYYDINFI